jgi:hypothetical protein
MAIEIVDWPAAVPVATMSLDLIGRSMRSLSPLTGQEAVITQPGGSWQGVVTLRNLLPDEWQEFEGFRARLVVRGGVFRMRDWRVLAFRGGANGTLTASGTANALQVTISGIGGSSPFFRTGARFSIGERLHVVTADVTSAPGGVATVQIAPELRETVSGASVNVLEPTVLLRPASDSEGLIRLEAGSTGPEAIDVAMAVREYMGKLT